MTSDPSTVVVTGGAGMLGGAVTRELGAERRVRIADLVAPEGEMESVACDVREIDQVRAALAGADAVCHLAGLDFGRARGEEEYVPVNVAGSWNVLQAAAELGCRKVVLASSVCSYGLLDAPGRWLPRYLPVDEDHPQCPFSAYSASKAMVEEAGRTWARAAELEVIALQPLHVVSAASLPAYLEFVAAAERGWLHNYVVLEDVARAFRRAVEVELPGFHSFLVSAADSPLAAPTLSWFEQLTGSAPPRRRPADAFEREPRASVFSSRLAAELLGWRPRLRLADLDPAAAAAIDALAGLGP